MSWAIVYSIFCDDCGDWIGEEPSKAKAVDMARKAGWQVRGGHYCSTCREDV